MPTLNLKRDHADRPVIELYVGVSFAELEIFGVNASVPPRLARALVDTGASRTVIERSFLAQLGLDSVGTTELHSATSGGEPVRAALFAVSLALAEDKTGVLAADLAVVAAEDLNGLGVQALLGRDVLNRCLPRYDGPGRAFALTYEPFGEP